MRLERLKVPLADDLDAIVINQDKTKEIVFRRPRPSYFHIPLVAGNIEQLDSVKFLGVIVQNNLKDGRSCKVCVITVCTAYVCSEVTQTSGDATG